jgi:hypothetical protein
VLDYVGWMYRAWLNRVGLVDRVEWAGVEPCNDHTAKRSRGGLPANRLLVGGVGAARSGARRVVCAAPVRLVRLRAARWRVSRACATLRRVA